MTRAALGEYWSVLQSAHITKLGQVVDFAVRGER